MRVPRLQFVLLMLAGCEAGILKTSGSDGRTSDGAVSDQPDSAGAPLDAPGMDAARGDAPGFDGPVPDGPRSDKRKPDGPRVDKPRLDVRRPDGPRPDGPRPDSPRADAPRADGPVGVNSAPRPVRQRVWRTSPGTSVSFTPFVDPNNDPLTLTLSQAPANGTVTLAGALCTYAPKAGARGRESFKLAASDGKASSGPVQFVVSVGTTYHVSSAGDDAKDGKDPTRAWRTLDKVNASSFLPEDWVLFRRGDSWHGHLDPVSGSTAGYVKYGAYGTGKKPRLLGSQTRSNTSDWTLVAGTTDTWTTGVFSAEVGNIIFNEGQAVGIKRWARNELQGALDYWYNTATGRVELRSTTNPAASYQRIDLALNIPIIDENGAHHVIYEGLELRYSAREGICGPNTHHIIVRGCDFHWIGGASFGMDGTHHVRLGNGVEFYDSAHDNVVEGCNFSQMFDGPITNQGDADGSTVYNITYRNNVMWNNEECIEIWLQGNNTSMSNIVVENNTCINTGYGWSHSQRWGEYGWDLGLIQTTAKVSNVVIRNNIFYGARKYAIAVSPTFNDLQNVVFDNNLLLPASGGVVSAWGATMCPTLAAHQATSGQDQHSISASPAFQSGPTGTHFLASTSPAVDKGYSDASQACLDLLGEVICLSDLTTRVDLAADTGKADLGAHFEP